MLSIAKLAKMPPLMIRSISLFVAPKFAAPKLVAPMFVAAFACALSGGVARAQMSQADLVTRIDRLEATIRELTGAVEQLQYRNQQLEQQLRSLQDAVQTGARPQVSASPPPRPAGQYSPLPAAPPAPPAPVIAAAPPPPAPVEQEPPSNRRGDAFNPALNPNAPGVPRPLGASTAATEPPPQVAEAAPAAPAAAGPRQPGAPLDLSSVSAPPIAASSGAALPPPPPINPSATGAMQAALPPGNTPKDEYDLGYGYIQHKDYATAAETFSDFLRKYPSDRMAPEAQYWLGEALFQSQRYRDAAEAFLAVSTKYETTARAPDALLRLGMSLAALGEKEAACASLGEVLRKYPRASPSVKQGVDREQKRAHC
jgi:tol-pal system protein YbgF